MNLTNFQPTTEYVVAIQLVGFNPSPDSWQEYESSVLVDGERRVCGLVRIQRTEGKQ